MLNNDKMIEFQAECHDLVKIDNFSSKQDYVLHLIHCKAYHTAAKLANNGTVLDLGCNLGYGTSIISKASNLIIGVDVSNRAIESARSKYKESNIDFKLVDGKILPFEDKMFDLVVSFQVLEHLVEYNNYFSEVKRVLKDDGIFLLSTPNATLRLKPGMKPFNPFHHKEFTYDELNILLSNWFQYSNIYGLFAEKEIYEIEYNRVKLGLENSLKRNNGIYLMRNIIRDVIPDTLIYKLKEILHNYYKKSNKGIKDVELINFISKYSINHLTYENCNTENSLDFLAICSDHFKHDVISNSDIIKHLNQYTS